MTTTQKAKEGFTLFEIMIAIAIIGGLLAIFYPAIQRYRAQARVKTAKLTLGQIKNAIDLFQADTKQYPTNLQDLIRKPSDPKIAAKWAAPYADEDLVEDENIMYRRTQGGKHPYELTYTIEDMEEPIDVWKR